jgi:hypothetical protein
MSPPGLTNVNINNIIKFFYSSVFEKIATRKPRRVDIPTTQPPLKYASGIMAAATAIGNKRAPIKPMTKAARMIDSNINYKQGQGSSFLVSPLSW